MVHRALRNIAAFALGVVLFAGGCRAKRSGGGAPSTSSPTNVLENPSVNWGPSLIAFADIDGDGIEDIVGPCMDPEAQAPVSFCAFSGAKLRLLWRSPALTEIHNAYEIAIAVVGRRGVFIDPRANAHVFDLASGRETSSVKLADRAREVCNPTEHADRLWLELETDQGFLLDPKLGTLAEAARPASCINRRNEYRCSMVSSDRDPECRALPKPPKVADFQSRTVKLAGTRGIALGEHARGTRYPMLVGFDLAGGDAKARWSRPLFDKDPLAGPSSAERIALAGERAFTEYETHRPHLLAVSLADGKTLWDVESGHTSGFVATASRVYVHRYQRLEIRDAKTGALIGGIGTR